MEGWSLEDENDDICIPMRMLDEEVELSRFSDAFIFKVPRQLRQVNMAAYEPVVISIGPYHFGKHDLREMETHKLRYLKMLLQRTPGDNREKYFKAMEEIEEEARRCYAESVPLSSPEFVRMLVLDGCFIIELIRKFTSKSLVDERDHLFKHNFNLSIVGHDLLLFENQLPFFVLDKLYNMTKPEYENAAFVEMALRFFSEILPGPGIRAGNYHCSVQNDGKRIKHLLGLVKDNWLPSLEAIERSEQHVTDGKWKLISSAKTLLEMGIKFKKASGDQSSLFDIKFNKGQLQIPTLTINHDTERIFRNLIAFEQFNEGPTYVMDYTRFMDCLINYGEDVEVLSQCGIIVNWLGSNGEVADMFNELNKFVYLSTSNFYYSEVFDAVNEYSGDLWTSLKIKLRSKYFYTPWDWVLASIISGTVLLLLTLVQTVFTVLSYFKQAN